MMPLVYVLLPLAFVAAELAPGPRGWSAYRVVKGTVLYQVFLLVSGLVLGSAGLMFPRPYTVVDAIALAGMLVVAWRRRPWRHGLESAMRWLRTRRGAVVVVIGCGIALLFAIQLATDAWLGTRQVDALIYHVPRAVVWSRQGSFRPWVTPTWQQVGLPTGADVVLGSKILLGLGWAGAAYVNAVLTLGAACCVYVAGVDLGVGRWRSALGALLFASFPAVGERVSAFSSDMAAAFPVMAGYVLWTRAADRHRGLAWFILLAGAGLACKPTVLPFAVLLGLVAAVRRTPASGAPARAWAAPAGATLAAAAIGLASFWPVREAFGDFVGGAMGHHVATHDAATAARAVVVNAVNWLLEPLGYIPYRFRGPLTEWVERIYRALGVRFELDPLGTTSFYWQPWPMPDTGRTGALALAALPAVVAMLPRRARSLGVPLFAAGFVAISAMVYLQPWSGRFTVVLLGGYALLWVAARPFSRPHGRKWLTAIVAANVCAAIAVALVAARTDIRESKEGGELAYLSFADRAAIAHLVGDRPVLLVSSPGSRDALVSGPEVAFATEYLACPEDGDWRATLERAGSRSPVVAVTGPTATPVPRGGVRAPGEQSCLAISGDQLRRTLRAAGWRCLRAAANLELWTR